MLRKIKRNIAKNKDNNVVDATPFLEQNDNPKEDALIETTLSIPDHWDMTNEDRYVFAFHNSESPKLKVNQISIYGMEITQTEQETIEVTGLIRSTVTQPIQFQPTTILLLDENKKVIAKKEFDLEQLGTLPPNSARPWTFIFSNEDIVKDVEFPISAWSLAFELKQAHQLDLEESWEKSIAEDTKKSLQEIVDNAPPLKPGEVNFMGINAKQKENNDLAVTILIRNGSDKNITLEQIPLGVRDANKKEIAKGSFKLDNFIVKANTSKPWTFIFPSSMVTDEEFDLSKWEAYPIQ